jgi:hypothetical protein
MVDAVGVGLASRIGLGEIRIVLSVAVSRLARNSSDQYRLLGCPHHSSSHASVTCDSSLSMPSSFASSA